MGERLTDQELSQLVQLLRQYGETDLDQFQHWRIDTSYGPLFVGLRRAPFEGVPAEGYGRPE